MDTKEKTTLDIMKRWVDGDLTTGEADNELGKMETDRDCAFYIKGGMCSNKEAPNPGHSRCIGLKNCTEFRTSPLQDNGR